MLKARAWVILVCIPISFAAGWYAGNRQQHVKTAQAIQAGLSSTEGEEMVEAIRAARALQSLSAGDTNEASRLLAATVANFYALNTDTISTNKDAARILTVIENLARTNRIVAERIAEAKTNMQGRLVRKNP